jgi:hypothetical protein
MNAEERASIRAKHKPEGWPTKFDPEVIVCEACSWWQDDSIEVEFPCDAILALDALDELSERVRRAVGLANEYLEDEESLVREDPFTAGTCQVASELLAILTENTGVNHDN